MSLLSMQLSVLWRGGLVVRSRDFEGLLGDAQDRGLTSGCLIRGRGWLVVMDDKLWEPDTFSYHLKASTTLYLVCLYALTHFKELSDCIAIYISIYYYMYKHMVIFLFHIHMHLMYTSSIHSYAGDMFLGMCIGYLPMMMDKEKDHV